MSLFSLKRVNLELGGNAPFVVFESADIYEAVKGLILCKFRCSGQTCVSANRIFVHESIMNDFCRILLEKVKNLKIGNGFDSSSDCGPLINKRAVEKVNRLVENAISSGACLELGGLNSSLSKGYFYPPTVLTKCKSSMSCGAEEIFGPVAPIIEFSSEDQLIKTINQSSTGLAAYFYSKDVDQIWRVSSRIQSGMIGVNTGLISGAEIPFGGIKDSGIGREGGPNALHEFMDIKYVCWKINDQG